MKINVLSSKVICSNPYSIHRYFAWPSVARLQDGRLAMVASGFRTDHICPFGKSVICYSANEGESWSLPAPVIDTPLDDRDSGIAVFGEKNVIATSFNNSVAFQREESKPLEGAEYLYRNSYLDMVEQRQKEGDFLGSTYRISNDGGVTFGELKRIPVTCPHGPAVLSDGTLLYVGKNFSHNDSQKKKRVYIACYHMFADGSYEHLCDIENVEEGYFSCEPYAIELEDGTILVHIRVQQGDDIFTIYQSKSTDGGRSFTKPRQILADKGGAPAHIIKHNGILISTYGYRNEPYGIRAMFSTDDGKTWDTDHVIVDDGLDWDLGYPCSVAVEGGKILTVYYGRPPGYDAPAINQVIWEYQL